MAISQVIKFDGPTNGQVWTAYKFPADQFVLGSHLIVNPSQEAVFIKGGEICDVFTAGTHVLQTGNLPLLRKLINASFGGKTPFTAEIFFINKASKLDMNWGTATPFQLEDPKYGIIVSIRAHGKYGIKIVNSGLFVGELVGSAPSNTLFTPAFINSYFNSMLIACIKTHISAFMVQKKISFLEVTSYLTELSKECNEAISGEFEKYGIEIINLCIETISPPASDFESLKKMKEKYAMGESFYINERRMDLLDKFAENPSNPAINMGAGLGVGISVSKEMINTFQNVMSTGDTNASPQQQTLSQSSFLVCPDCSASVPANQKFCGNCGRKMENKCPNCGKTWGLAQKFCGECGAKL